MKKEQKKYEYTSDDMITIVLCTVLGTLFVFGFFCLLAFNDVDLVNTDDLGKIVCKQNGLVYDHREIVTYTINGESYSYIPIIYCKQPNTQEELALVRIK